MSATTDLAAQLQAVLDASPLGRDEKVKAVAHVRRGLDAPNTSTDQWRRDRVRQGPVGSGKKATEMRDAMGHVSKRR